MIPGLEYGAPVRLDWSASQNGLPGLKRAPAFASAPPRPMLIGYATRYGKPHAGRNGLEAFRSHAFAASLAADREVRFLRMHEPNQCLGSTADGSLTLADTNQGVAFRFEVPDDAAGEALLRQVREGKVAMSIGFTARRESRPIIEGEPIRVLEHCELHEISCVDRPAVPGTSIVEAPPDFDLAEACRSGRLAHLVAAETMARGLRTVRAML